MNYSIVLLLFISVIIKSATAQNVEDYFQLGKNYFNQKEYLKAKQKFSFVVSHSDYYYEAYNYRGRTYVYLNQPDSAMADYAKAIKMKADYMPTYFFRAELFFSQKEYVKALADLDKVISQKSSFIPAILLRAQIYEIQNKGELALKDYSKAIDNGTKEASVFFRRGLYYNGKTLYRNALSDFDKALSINPKYAEAWYQKGHSLQNLNQISKAIEAYNQAILQDPEMQIAYERRAYLLAYTKNYAAAIGDYEQLISHFKLRSDTLFIRNASAKMATGDLADADRDLVKALSSNSKSELALLMRAQIAMKKEKGGGSALSYLQRLVKLNPKHSEAWMMIGQVFFNQKNYLRAIENFDESIRCKASAEAYYLRGICFSEMKEKSKACADTQKAADMGHTEAQRALNIICR
jgi:tetratricopeptide (TPR) repeat protein